MDHVYLQEDRAAWLKSRSPETDAFNNALRLLSSTNIKIIQPSIHKHIIYIIYVEYLLYIISIINKYAEKAVSLLLLFKEREPFARLWDFDAAEHDRTFGLRPPGNQDQTFIFPPYCVFWKEEIGGGWFVVSNTIQVSLYFISAVLMLPLAGNFQVIVWKRYFAKFRQTSNKYYLFLLINFIIFFDQIL